MITKEREKIRGATVIDDLWIMTEGNPGATVVLSNILTKDPVTGYITILHLDDMNIRGAQIWIGYKDVCGQDLDLFVEKVKARDEAMIVAINESLGHDGWQAVIGGASYMETRPRLKRAR